MVYLEDWDPWCTELGWHHHYHGCQVYTYHGCGNSNTHPLAAPRHKKYLSLFSNLPVEEHNGQLVVKYPNV